MKATLHFDGGSRGNPGPSGYGYTLHDSNGRLLFECGNVIEDEATNNEAEYIALVMGLKTALQIGVRGLAIRGDSKLVVNQVAGVWKVKSPHLRSMCAMAQGLVAQFPESVTFEHVHRERNRRADELANLALDAGGKVMDGEFERLLPLMEFEAISLAASDPDEDEDEGVLVVCPNCRMAHRVVV